MILRSYNFCVIKGQHGVKQADNFCRYGFPEEAASVEFLGEIGGVEVEWTLGALLSELLSSAAADSGATAAGARRRDDAARRGHAARRVEALGRRSRGGGGL